MVPKNRVKKILLKPSMGGFPLIVIVVLLLVLLGLTAIAFFKEKEGVFWLLYRNFPSPLNNALLWEIIGPLIVAMLLFPLIKRIDQNLKTLKEIVKSPDCPKTLVAQLENKLKIVVLVWAMLVFACSFMFPEDKYHPSVISSFPFPLNNLNLWLWIEVAILLGFGSYFLRLSDILGKIDIKKKIAEVFYKTTEGKDEEMQK